MEEGPSARFSAGAVSLGPYKAGSFFFVGGCNKSLEPLDDIYYLHTGFVFYLSLGRLLIILLIIFAYCQQMVDTMHGLIKLQGGFL